MRSTNTTDQNRMSLGGQSNHQGVVSRGSSLGGNMPVAAIIAKLTQHKNYPCLSDNVIVFRHVIHIIGPSRDVSGR